MSRYLILAQSDVTARALGAWLELLGERPLTTVEARLDDERVMFAREVSGEADDFVHTFKRISASLSRALDGCAQEEAVVLVDSIRPAELSAVGSPGGWDRLIGLLILAFPEVRWAFGVSSGKKCGWWDARYGLASLFGPRFDPLFDGTGLRAYVRRITAKHRVAGEGRGRQKVAGWIPHRRAWALAIDDESVYAYLHAYTAYRHGFRAFAVHSLKLADHLLSKEAAAGTWKLGAPRLTLEDYYLGFPDRGSGKRYAHLRNRSDEEHWPVLKKVRIRHFITSGHGRSQGEENVRDNRAFRAELKADRRGGMEATKPIAGIFALWKELGLNRTLRDADSKFLMERGLAPGFVWPPKDEHRGHHESGSGHSAPGLLLLVAETLIDRAERMLDSVRNVKDAVRGAVLATSALELLGPKTPTTARDALELKHRFEALAECQFGGVQFNLELDERFEEIRSEVRLLGEWHGTNARASATLNAELTIVTRLMAIYRDAGEFDEEEACLREIRRLQRAIWWKRSRRNPIAAIVYAIRAYIEWLLDSAVRFTGAILAWIGFLTLSFYLLFRFDTTDETGSEIWVSYALETAFRSFFGSEGTAHPNLAVVLIGSLGAVAGFIHLGVFISWVYSLISRR